jgi:hypothetical protein
VFKVQSYASQEYKSSSGPSSIPEASRRARTVFSAANQSISGEPSGEPLFPSAGTRGFAPFHDDPGHKNWAAARAVARGLRFWLVPSWDPVRASAQKRHCDDLRGAEIGITHATAPFQNPWFPIAYRDFWTTGLNPIDIAWGTLGSHEPGAHILVPFSQRPELHGQCRLTASLLQEPCKVALGFDTRCLGPGQE